MVVRGLHLLPEEIAAANAAIDAAQLCRPTLTLVC